MLSGWRPPGKVLLPMIDPVSELSFLEWLGTLNDEDHHRVVEMLCSAAAELRVASGKIVSFCSDDLLKLETHITTELFIN